jgi:GDP-fucose transporter C1
MTAATSLSSFSSLPWASKWAEWSTIASAISFYFIISISMVFLNKELMSPTISTPLFLVWFQCFVTLVICWVLGFLSRHTSISLFQGYPSVSYNWTVGRKILPLSVIFVFMIAFNQLCLKYVEVSFYNVARSLTILFNVIFSLMLLGQRTSTPALGALAIVIVGFFVGSTGEVNFSLFGTLFGVASSVCVALNSVYTSSALAHVEGDKTRLIFYNNVNAVLLLFPLAVFEALTTPDGTDWVVGLVQPSWWAVVSLSGLLGYLIGVATVWQIQVTTPLTHNISGTAKAAVQSVIAFAYYRNPVASGVVVGLTFTLGGSLLYTYIRMSEDLASKNAKADVAADKASVLSAAGDADADATTDVEFAGATAVGSKSGGYAPVALEGDERDVEAGLTVAAAAGSDAVEPVSALTGGNLKTDGSSSVTSRGSGGGLSDGGGVSELSDGEHTRAKPAAVAAAAAAADADAAHSLLAYDLGLDDSEFDI